ncbi:MAG: class I SAM-dependent methyltransferase [Betaproteobacteria bacterium]
MRKRLKEKLSATLPSEALKKVYSSFDIIGDIAIIKTAYASQEEAQAVAKQIHATHKNIKTVLMQTSAIEKGYRIRGLKLLTGENKTTAAHKESGCTFQVDVDKCYFSPRLSHERARIAKLVQPDETIVNMFAGVGCFSIIIAKMVPQTKVYSIDINPAAFQCMVENVRCNRVFDSVYPLFGDAKHIIETQLQGVADRVLMPLPELSLQYLTTALLALKPSGGWIHFHDFQHATAEENPVEKTKQKVAEKLGGLNADYEIANTRVVRSTGPNWWHIVLDIKVTRCSSKF